MYTCVHIHSRCALHKLFTQLIRLLLRKCILPSHMFSNLSNWTNVVSQFFTLKYCWEDHYFVHLAESTHLSWGLPSQGLYYRLWLRLIGKTGQLLHGACLLYLDSAPHFCGNSNTHSLKKKVQMRKILEKCLFHNKRNACYVFVCLL